MKEDSKETSIERLLEKIECFYIEMEDLRVDIDYFESLIEVKDDLLDEKEEELEELREFKQSIEDKEWCKLLDNLSEKVN